MVSLRLFNWTIDLLPDMKVKVDQQNIVLPYLNEPYFSIQKLGKRVGVDGLIDIWGGGEMEGRGQVVARGSYPLYAISTQQKS